MLYFILAAVIGIGRVALFGSLAKLASCTRSWSKGRVTWVSSQCLLYKHRSKFTVQFITLTSNWTILSQVLITHCLDYSYSLPSNCPLILSSPTALLSPHCLHILKQNQTLSTMFLKASSFSVGLVGSSISIKNQVAPLERYIKMWIKGCLGRR